MNILPILALLYKQLPYRHPRLALRRIPQLIRFYHESETFKKLIPSITFSLYPMLDDNSESSGNLTYHYFYQDLWMAQQVLKYNPANLMDIGSRIDGYVAHVASFRKIHVLDIRPLVQTIPNVTFSQFDIMQGAGEFASTADAVSSLHVIEHFGLGRYGDSIDPNGHLRGFNAIFDIIKPGGLFFFSTIIGQDAVQFNAHRIFSLNTLLRWFEDRYTIENFAYVDDDNNLVQDAVLTPEVIDKNANLSFGCGLFVLRKNPCVSKEERIPD